MRNGLNIGDWVEVLPDQYRGVVSAVRNDGPDAERFEVTPRGSAQKPLRRLLSWPSTWLRRLSLLEVIAEEVATEEMAPSLTEQRKQ